MQPSLIVATPQSEYVERRLPMWKVGSLNLSRVKPMTYKIDILCYLDWRLALIGQDMDWLAYDLDNVSVWGIRSWFQQLGLPVGQHYKVAMSVHCY